MYLSHKLLRSALQRQNYRPLVGQNVSIRHHSSNTSSAKSDPITQNAIQTDWQTIYKFPYISAIVRLNRVKVYQAAFTSIGVPICMGLESADILSSGVAQIFAVLGECFA